MPAAKQPKVVHLVDSLRVGGLERAAVLLANQRSHVSEATVAATRESGPLQHRLSPTVELYLAHRKSRWDLSAALKFCDWLQSRQINIVHAHGSSILFALQAAILLRRRVAVVWHIHYWIYQYPIYKIIVRLASPFVAQFICVSEPIKSFLAAHLPGRLTSIHLLANPIEVDSTAEASIPDPMILRLINVANLRPEKNQLGLVRAVIAARQKGYDVRLTLVGQPIVESYARQIRTTIQNASSTALQLLEDVTDPQQLLREHDLGILFSLNEGLPLALLEYGVAGLPVIVSDTGDCAAVVRTSRGGTVVPVDDEKALTEALCNAFRNRPALAANGRALRDYVVANHDVRLIDRALLDIYERALIQSQ